MISCCQGDVIILLEATHTNKLFISYLKAWCMYIKILHAKADEITNNCLVKSTFIEINVMSCMEIETCTIHIYVYFWSILVYPWRISVYKCDLCYDCFLALICR